MNVAVIGANGQLGCHLVRAFSKSGDQVFTLPHADVEVANRDSVRSALEGMRQEIIVNTAAMHHVENCEHERGRADAINALGARNVAVTARHIGAVIVHVSTDYVVDGCKGEACAPSNYE